MKEYWIVTFDLKKHTDSLNEQRRTKHQETLEFKIIKQTQNFPFSSPKNLHEEGKWLLRVFLFQCKNSAFNITTENSSFAITIPSHWQTKSDEETIDEFIRL